MTADHSAHSKRALATDLLAAMSELGHNMFAVAGHDRGGRVAYRMALDHPAAVSRLAVLDIVPTGEIWSRADASFALGYWQWAFLATPAPLPEQMILANPDAFWTSAQRLGLKDDERYPKRSWRPTAPSAPTPRRSKRCARTTVPVRTIDRQLDDADRGRRTIACPVLALWGSDGALPRFYDDPLDLWRVYAPQITGRAVQNASHFLVEDAPKGGRRGTRRALRLAPFRQEPNHDEPSVAGSRRSATAGLKPGPAEGGV